MAGGLVKYGSAFGEFFNHEETAIVFNDGGDGDVGSEAHAMLLGRVADGSAPLSAERDSG